MGSAGVPLGNFESVTDLITSDNSVVAFVVIKAVIDETLKLSWSILLVLLCKVPDFLEFIYLVLLMQ